MPDKILPGAGKFKKLFFRVFLLISCCLTAVILSNCAPKIINLRLFFYKQELKNALQELVDAFSLNHPGIAIKTEMFPDDSISVLKSMFINGNAPELIQLKAYAEVREFAAAGRLLDLSGEQVIARTQSGYRSAVTYDSKVYALPMDFSGIGIIYNTQIFKENNLQPPQTFSDLKRVCYVLKSKGIAPFAGMLKVNWSAGHFMTLLHAALAKTNAEIEKWIVNMNSGKGSWADPVHTDTLFGIMDFYYQNLDPLAGEKKEVEQVAKFMSREAGMMVQGLWVGLQLRTNPLLEWGFIPFPATDNPEETKFYADIDSAFAVSAAASTAKQAAAKKFLDWLSTKEATRLWAEKCLLIPAFKEADLSSLPVPFRDFLEHYKQHGCYNWEFCRYPVPVYSDAVKNSALGYLCGRLSREDVIRNIDISWRNARR